MAASAVPQYDIPERKDKLVVFDGSYLADIPLFLAQWQCKRAIVVASKALYSTTTHVQQLESALGSALVWTKIGVGSHSPYADVIAIAHKIQSLAADCIICVGSSSYSDACKAASKLAATLGPDFTADDVDAMINPARGTAICHPARVRLVLVPTSLSAAEWNGTASATNSHGKKQHFGVGDHRSGAADLVLCDPELAMTAPRRLWLSSGVRCIDHCVETVCNAECGPDAEADALKGLHEMVRGLRAYAAATATDHGHGLDRALLLRGATSAQRGSREALKSMILYGNTFGPSHAIGHQLGGVARVLHGETTCVLLPAVLRYTLASADPVFARAGPGQAAVLATVNEALGWNEAAAADAIARLVRELGLPGSLSEVGVVDDRSLDTIAEKTLTDVWGGGEPQIRDKAEIRKILDSAR